jgi:hypothetical protein
VIGLFFRSLCTGSVEAVFGILSSIDIEFFGGRRFFPARPGAGVGGGQAVDFVYGLVAQRIERLRPKEGVGGSSPSEAAKFKPQKLYKSRQQFRLDFCFDEISAASSGSLPIRLTHELDHETRWIRAK